MAKSSLLTNITVDIIIFQLLILFDMLLRLWYVEESMSNIRYTIAITCMSNISYKNVHDFFIYMKLYEHLMLIKSSLRLLYRSSGKMLDVDLFNKR